MPDQPPRPPTSTGIAATLSVNSLRKRWRIIALTVLLVCVGAFLWTYRAPKIYSASCTIIIDPSAPRVFNNNVSEVVEMGSGSYWADIQFYQTQYKIIGSKDIAQKVVERLGLGADVDYPVPHAGTPGQVRDVTGSVMGQTSVKPIKDSRLATITVEDRQPERAAQIANAIANAYIENNLDYKLEGTNAASTFLGDQVVAVGDKLKRAELAVYEYRRKHQLLDTSLDARQSLISQNVQTFTQKLAELRLKKLELDSARKMITGTRNNVDAEETLPEVRENTVIQQLRVTYVDLSKTLAELETTYGDKHPKIEALKNKLVKVRQEYVSEIDKLLKANDNRYLSLEDNELALNKMLNKEKHDAIELSKLEVEYRPLVREADDTLNLYKLITQRQKETGLSGLVRTNNVRIMDLAVPNGSPVKPRPFANLALSLFIGLMLGIGAAVGAEALDNTIKSQEEVEAVLGVPVLGMLPIMGERTVGKSSPEEQKERDLSVFHDLRSAAAEACRSIRTNLMFLSPDNPLKTLVVTSPGPEEGKTTTAINLAITMAQAGGRVLLIDTDLRRPRIHRAFGMKNSVGISNAVVGEKTLDEVVFQTVVPNLDVCPCGPLPPNPAELLHTRKFKDLMAECGRRYDRVIFDSPPTSAVTDPVIVGHLADGVVLVVRAGHTTREAALFARRQLDDAKARLLGCIVNQVNPADPYYNYYYRSYQYGGYYGPREEGAKA
ncbi:MAG TPA: polysaccharide biosynthesis tyrosine autokinase [Polyangia bacterium]|jgi:capsular exopolysaccharide synthesis family protein